jgi:hypothetical protein
VSIKVKIDFGLRSNTVNGVSAIYQLDSFHMAYDVLRQRGTSNSIGQLTLTMDKHRDSRLSLVQLSSSDHIFTTVQCMQRNST